MPPRKTGKTASLQEESFEPLDRSESRTSIAGEGPGWFTKPGVNAQNALPDQLRPNGCTALRSWKLGASLQGGLYVAPLLSAQSRELEAVVSSQCPNDFGRDRLLVGVGQRNLKDNRLAGQKSVSYESAQAALAKIAHPTLQGKLLFAPVQVNLNPGLKTMTG